jgi:hypothetical protein
MSARWGNFTTVYFQPFWSNGTYFQNKLNATVPFTWATVTDKCLLEPLLQGGMMNLLADHETSAPDEWLLERMRLYRDALLVASDWAMIADTPTDKTAWATYRQATCVTSPPNMGVTGEASPSVHRSKPLLQNYLL